MRCTDVREAISAGLDGESPGMPQLWVDQHLEECLRCRGWAEAAAEVTRRARLAPAEPVPDVTATVLAHLPPASRTTARVEAWRSLFDVGLRWVLMLVGFGQLLLGGSVLASTAGTAMGMVMPRHLSHETGAWNLALAVCFLVVAARPRWAAGSLPFLLPFTAVLSWVTVEDLRSGAVPVDRAADHLLLVLGVVLISVLAHRRRESRRGPVAALTDLLARWTPAGDRTRRGPSGSSTGSRDDGGPIVASDRAAA